MLVLIILVFMCLILIRTFIKWEGISPLVKVLTFLYVSILLRIGNTITERNLSLMERDKVVIEWITLVIYGVFWTTVLISFITIIIWKSHFSKLKSFIWYTTLICVLTGMEFFWNWLGYIHFIQWNLFYAIIRIALVIISTIIFLCWIDKKVIKI